METIHIEIDIKTRDELPFLDPGDGEVVVRLSEEGGTADVEETLRFSRGETEVGVDPILGMIAGAFSRASLFSFPLRSVSERPEITANVTLDHILKSGGWTEFCAWKGWNSWILNEGLADKSEEVRVPIRLLKEWGVL